MAVSAGPQVHLSQFPVIQALLQHIQRAKQQHLTGSLNFDTVHVPRMRLFFVVGRLIWASGGSHRFRRWRRLLKQYCPQAALRGVALSPTEETLYWEYEVLGKLVEGGHISLEAARSLIQANLIEVLFDIAQASKLIERFSRTESSFLSLHETIALIPTEDLIAPLEDQWRRWCGAHLGQYSPNLAPAIAQPDLLRAQVQPETYDRLSQLLRGELSLRELSLILSQDLQSLSQSMIAYEQQGVLELRVTPDLARKAPARPSPSRPSIAGPARVSLSPRILCVDDSLTICEQMGAVLEGAGYRYTSVQDPVKALQIVIEEKPDLIFIDLIMPVVSGYELCSQIRRMEIFQETPLIMFSGNLLDNLRAKMAGADEFLSKPIAPETLLATARLWLSPHRPVMKSFRLTR